MRRLLFLSELFRNEIEQKIKFISSEERKISENDGWDNHQPANQPTASGSTYKSADKTWNYNYSKFNLGGLRASALASPMYANESPARTSWSAGHFGVRRRGAYTNALVAINKSDSFRFSFFRFRVTLESFHLKFSLIFFRHIWVSCLSWRRHWHRRTLAHTQTLTVMWSTRNKFWCQTATTCKSAATGQNAENNHIWMGRIGLEIESVGRGRPHRHRVEAENYEYYANSQQSRLRTCFFTLHSRP